MSQSETENAPAIGAESIKSMKRIIRTGLWLSTALLLTLPLDAEILMDWTEADTAVGSGPNRAGLVIDWNDGSAQDTLRWSIAWDQTPGSVADLLLALEGLDPRFDARFTDFGGSLGLFTDGFGFDVEASSPADYTASQDHLQDRNGGWIQTFSFWYGTATDTAWTESGTGISATPVQHNQVYGFAWNDTGAFPAPPPPVVPEPTALSLLLLGSLWTLRRRSQP